MWICGCGGILLDAVFLALASKIPENANDIGVVAECFYSFIHLAFVIAASYGQSGLAVAGIVLPVIPEIMKFFRLSAIVKGTGGWSLVGVAACDTLFLEASAIIGFVLIEDALKDTARSNALVLATSR